MGEVAIGGFCQLGKVDLVVSRSGYDFVTVSQNHSGILLKVKSGDAGQETELRNHIIVFATAFSVIVIYIGLIILNSVIIVVVIHNLSS